MPNDRDLEIARNQLANMGLPRTAATVEAMLGEPRLAWNHLDAFLRELEAESATQRPAVKETFLSLEGVLMTAIGGRAARRSHIVTLARTAPPVDDVAQRMARVFPAIHDSFQRLAGGGDTASALLMALFGHQIRYQLLADVVHPWVAHWGRGLTKADQRAAVQFLLTLAYAVGPQPRVVADTAAYRHAIAHGHFQVEGQVVRFWHHDQAGKLVGELHPLNAADIVNLYNLGELRLRAIEAFTRTLIGWARHVDLEPSDAPSETAH